MVKLVIFLLYNFWVLHHFQKKKKYSQWKTLMMRGRVMVMVMVETGRQGDDVIPFLVVGRYCSRSLMLIMSFNP